MSDRERPVIRRVRSKVLYVVVAWVIGTVVFAWVIERPLVASGAPMLPFEIAGAIILLAQFWVGSRLFRGDVETDDPRAWWRATARPIAGFVIAGLLFLAAIVSVIPVVALPEKRVLAQVDWWAAVANLIVAVFYLTSSLRLARIERRLLAP